MIPSILDAIVLYTIQTTSMLHILKPLFGLYKQVNRQLNASALSIDRSPR
jgi:hypothetical protein